MRGFDLLALSAAAAFLGAAAAPEVRPAQEPTPASAAPADAPPPGADDEAAAGEEGGDAAEEAAAVSGASAPAEGGATAVASTTAALTLGQVVARYLRQDPSLPAAALERELASLRVALSQDRWRVGADGYAPIGYDLYAMPGQVLHVGSAEIVELGASVDDPLGGGLRASAAGRLLTDPTLESGGNTVGVDLSYRLPLWRNQGGRLYALETDALSRVEEARAAEVEATRLDRCLSAVDLYLTTYVLQEHAVVWQELLDHKERTYQRTARDYRRKLVTRLDFLTAKSDRLATRQRFEAFRGQRRQAQVVLATYLAPASEGALASPEAELAELPAALEAQALRLRVEAHPALAVLSREAEALEARAHLADRSYTPELALVPRLGAQYLSHMLVGVPGSGGNPYVPVTNLYASLGLSVDWPVYQPGRDVEQELYARQRQQVLLQRAETARFLEERALAALEVIQAADARLALTEEKLENIRRQIGEAGAQYGNGRLEFQDYLQHWAFFEEARFEQLDLLHARWRGQVALARAVGPTPALCRQGE